MKSRSLALLGLEVLSLCVFCWHGFIPGPLPAKGLPPWFSFPFIAIFYVALGLGLYKLIILYAHFLARKTGRQKTELAGALVLTLTPLVFLLFKILQYFYFLNDIEPLLFPVALAGCAYLHFTFLARLRLFHSWKVISAARNFYRRFDRLSRTQTAVMLFVLAFIVYITLLCGIFFPSPPITGDEPHYLLISKSLLRDGDINLFNNYKNKDYFEFYPGLIDPHGNHGPKGEESFYSHHFPLMPLLLVPFFAFGEKTGHLVFMVRFPFTVLTALLGALFFLFAWDLTKNKKAAFLAWVLFCFTAPMLFYSRLVFTEVPAALILLTVFHHLVYKRKFSRRLLFLAGAGSAVLPWLGIKYLVLLLAVSGAVFISMLKATLKKMSHFLWFCGPIGLSLAGLVVFSWTVFGTLHPATIYQGVPTSKFYEKNILDIFRRLVGFFLDQRAGILIYSPVLILAIPGIYLLIKTLKKQALILLFPAGLWWLFLAWSSNYWGGFCPPGRSLFPVYWVLALAVAATLAWGENRFAVQLRRLLMFLSLAIAYLALKNPRLLYHENLSTLPGINGIYSNLLTMFSNSLIDLTQLLPALSNTEHRRWLPLLFWIPAILIMTALFLKKEKPRRQHFISVPVFSLICVLGFSFVALSYAFFDIRLNLASTGGMEGVQAFFQDNHHYEMEPEGFWTKGSESAVIFLHSLTPLKEMSLLLSRPLPGIIYIQVGNRKITSAIAWPAEAKKLIFRSPVDFPWRGGHLYFVKVRAESSFIPSDLDEKNPDNRSLGIFVNVAFLCGK